MGFSGAVMATDPAIIYWNPAGLALIDFQGVDLSISSPDINLPSSGSVLVANHLHEKKDMLGLGFTTRYTPFASSGVVHNYLSYAIFNPIAFAHPKLQRVGFGATPKFTMEKADDGWKYGYALDIGLMWRVWNELYTGATIQNLVGSPLKSFQRDAWAGISYGDYYTPLQFSAMIGLEKPRRRSYLATHFSYGASYRVSPKYPEIRGGYARRGDTGWITSGFSYPIPKNHTRLDYAILVNMADRSDVVQYLTWGYTIGPDPVAKALRQMGE